MSAIRAVCSVLKKAVLFVPRKIAACRHVDNHKPSFPVTDQLFYLGAIYQKEAHGPFVSTSVTEDAQGSAEVRRLLTPKYRSKIRELDDVLARLRAVSPNATITIRDGEHLDLSAEDQRFYFGK